jgi:hypothetical protein
MSIKRRGNLSSSRQPGIDPKIQYELAKLKRSIPAVTFGDQFPPNPQVGDMHFYEGADTDEFKTSNWYNSDAKGNWKSMSGSSVEGTAIRGEIPTGVKIADYLSLSGGSMIGDILFASTQKLPGDKIEGTIPSGVTIADYLPIIGGQLTGNLDMSRKNITRLNKLTGYDTDISIDMGVDNILRLYADLIRLDNHVTIGNGSTGIDYRITVDGETNDGLITWMEDEDYFLFADSILFPDSEPLYFGTGVDMSVDYDGVQGNIKTNLVAPSDLHLNCGTNKTLVLDTVVYNDTALTIGAGRVSGASFTATSAGFYGYRFNNGNSVEWDLQEISHGYKEGAAIEFHVHWVIDDTTPDTDARYVKWQLEYWYVDAAKTVAPFNVYSGVQTISAETLIPANTPAMSELTTSIATVTLASLKAGGRIALRLTRIVSVGAAPSTNPFALQVGIHIPLDTLGSRQIASK